MMAAATSVLEWERKRLLIDGRRRSARVAGAPDGTWYAVWRESYGWSVGHARVGLDFTEPPRTRLEAYELAGDAQLVAEVWAVGSGPMLHKHDYCNVVLADDDEHDWVADSWHCRCGASGLDFDNVGEAASAARAHWRQVLRAEIAHA